MNNRTYHQRPRINGRRRQIEEARRRRKRKRLLRRLIKRYLPVAAILLMILLGAAGCRLLQSSLKKNAAGTEEQQSKADSASGKTAEVDSSSQTTKESEGADDNGEPDTASQAVQTVQPSIPRASITEQTKAVPDEVVSTSAVLVDLNTHQAVAQRDATSRINPASMTKILTVLTAAEQVTNLDDTFTMTLEITDYSYVNDCSNAGFEADETLTVRDLFYGTILPSGAEAALGLATYVSGSQEAFVELMNQKLQELGISDTAHMTNCVGIYDANHYCTVSDMAVILEAALQNDLCREILSAKTYNTTATSQHPEGLLLSNWFLRRIEDKDTGGQVISAKTGYVQEAGSCAASYGMDHSGNPYICVTANSTSSWRCIYDQVAIYKAFSKGSEPDGQES